MSGVDVLMLGEVFRQRGRYVNPPDPGRSARHPWSYVNPPDPSYGQLGDVGDEDDPYIPDYNPGEAAFRCLEAGGVWDDATQICAFDDDDPAVKCAAAGGAWDPIEQQCLALPDGLPPGFVAPGPTSIAIGAWDTSHKPYALYQLKYGDTYVGLAKTYLDRSGVRWREIWDLNRAQHPSPDRIYVGQIISMPDEARDNFVRWANKGGDPGTLPSEDPRGGAASSSSKLWWLVGGVAVVGGGALAWKKWGRR